MHIWALGLSCETPAAPPERAAGARTRQPENSKRAHFRAPALQTPPKFHEKTPRERKKKENCGGRREKKARNYGLPTLRGSTLRGSTLRGPTLRGSTPSGPHPSGPPPFGAPLFLGLGLHPRGLHPLGAPPLWSKNSTSKNWPKSNWPKSKLAEVEIGRSRSRSNNVPSSFDVTCCVLWVLYAVCACVLCVFVCCMCVVLCYFCKKQGK